MVTWLVGAYGPDMDGTATGIAALTERAPGELAFDRVLVESQSPTFLAAHGDHIYATEEGTGTLRSFRRSADGGLEPDGAASVEGWPCHVAIVDGVAVAACYGGGAVDVVGLDAEGRVTERLQSIAFEGSGPHEEQDAAHLHATYRLDDDTLVALDLGSDRLVTFRIAGGSLERTGELALPAGTGPRDILRHSSGMLLVLGELGGVLFSIEWDGERLAVVACASIPGFEPGNNAAAISLGAGERFAYCGVRGANVIGVIAVSRDARELHAVTAVPTGGDWPRHHVLDGDFVHVANERSSTVTTLRIGADGIPSFVRSIDVPSPTYLLRLP